MVEPVRSRTQRIIAYGPLRTIVEVVDRGWQLPAIGSKQGQTINMTLRYTQYAGHRDTDVDVMFDKDVKGCLFSTGIINVKGSQEFSDHKGLRACWGTDYPSTDTVKWSRETVGLGILIPQGYIDREVAASQEQVQGGDYTFVVKTNDDDLHYKVIYGSANETFGYHSASEWFDYLKQWRREVEQPLKVKGWKD
jgi:hypothetical protein